ncbi:hypothetical protein [Rhizobium terrae]|uniref:hypothetical protein n=1 Tax=Rhizobium terrae TaxID=2171756 RepID=UPI0013C35E89|nr:hypothetical protein [Rhizobium terrae]
MAALRVNGSKSNTANRQPASIVILGHGSAIADPFELEPVITLSSEIPRLDLNATVAGCRHFTDSAAALHGTEIATFALGVQNDWGGKNLAAKGWNALWQFHFHHNCGDEGAKRSEMDGSIFTLTQFVSGVTSIT